MKLREHLTFNMWIVIRRAEDLPGQWVAHCLNVDVVTQGNSIKQALAMARAAVDETVIDDLDRRADPNKRQAPVAFWTEMFELMKRGRPLARTDEATEAETYALVVQVPMFFYRDHRRHAQRRSRQPAIWADAKPRNAAATS